MIMILMIQECWECLNQMVMEVVTTKTALLGLYLDDLIILAILLAQHLAHFGSFFEWFGDTSIISIYMA